MALTLRFAGVTACVAIAWVLALPKAPTVQPVAFAHARHPGMSCSVCHKGAESGEHAGIPEAGLCLQCHATAPRGVASERWEASAQGRPFAWVRVTRLPNHAYFSHRRHVGLGKLDCASCHADVGTSAVPPGRPPLRLDMDACLGCHRREGANQDCAGCHR
jgi:hypothetical protein